MNALKKYLNKLILLIIPSKYNKYIKKLDINKGDICIDCGANVGEVTKEFLKRGAKVYAFEPNPYAYDVLVKRFGKNRRAILLKKAVLDKNARMKLFFHENHSEDPVFWSTGSSLLNNKKNIDLKKGIITEVIDLDNFISEIGQKIKVLKLDVEGVESEILNKLMDTGTVNKINYIIVETHEEKNKELKNKIQKLKERIELEHQSNISLDWY